MERQIFSKIAVSIIKLGYNPIILMHKHHNIYTDVSMTHKILVISIDCMIESKVKRAIQHIKSKA